MNYYLNILSVIFFFAKESNRSKINHQSLHESSENYLRLGIANIPRLTDYCKFFFLLFGLTVVITFDISGLSPTEVNKIVVVA